ncbi:Rmf/CrpP fold protein [Streptomyces sp. SID5910]|uniref:Rmf/CrpP fold protein n=1 Tax=Streptomyces sp. SID5910 TaxID=2690312 RepID=UPI0019277771|nr:Rmf/CrpP fold protein [Streptomyces sp. SID5910]
MGTREDIVRAMQDGAEAGRRGDPPTACPHRDLLRTAWIRGYASTAPRPTEDDDA